jgi:hypothetical protein
LDLPLVETFFFDLDALFCFQQLLLVSVEPLAAVAAFWLAAVSFGLRWQAGGFFLPFFLWLGAGFGLGALGLVFCIQLVM